MDISYMLGKQGKLYKIIDCLKQYKPYIDAMSYYVALCHTCSIRRPTHAQRYMHETNM